MTRTLKTDDIRVAAIRHDTRVGWGTCTSIDECYDDRDLVNMLDCADILTAEGAVKWAHIMEGLHLEQGLNQRWGEDDDPQLEAWREWTGKGDQR